MTEPLPNWVYDLVSAVSQYEFEHGPADEGWPCLNAALKEVPAEVREGAAAIHRYRAQRGEITQPILDGTKKREHA